MPAKGGSGAGMGAGGPPGFCVWPVCCGARLRWAPLDAQGLCAGLALSARPTKPTKLVRNDTGRQLGSRLFRRSSISRVFQTLWLSQAGLKTAPLETLGIGARPVGPGVAMTMGASFDERASAVQVLSTVPARHAANGSSDAICLGETRAMALRSPVFQGGDAQPARLPQRRPHP